MAPSVLQIPLPDIALSPLVKGNETPIIQALLSSTRYGVLMTDLQGTDILCNPRFGELFGVDTELVVHSSREEVRRLALERVKDPDAFNRLMERVYADPSLEHEDEIELTLTPPRVLRRYTGPVLDSRGQNLGRVWTFDDVTEMRRLQAEVQAYAARLEEQYRRQARNLQTTTRILNVITAVFAALAESDSTEAMLGMLSRSTSRLSGWDCAALLEGVEGGALRGFFSRMGSDPTPLVVDSYDISGAGSDLAGPPRSGGRLCYITDLCGPLVGVLGCRTVAAARISQRADSAAFLVLGSSDDGPDLTSPIGEHLGAVVDQVALALEAHHLHAELQSAYDELRTAQEGLVQSAKLGAVGTLAASIAHDIRNILTPLKLELAMAGPDSPLAVASAHVDRLSALAHRLLAISQPSKCDHSAVDIRQVIDGIRPLMEHQAALDHIVIRSDWPEDLPAVRGDRSRLEHLFINLMLNGLNAMASRGGILHLSGSTHDENVQVDVADQGDGIEEGLLPKIFEPFFTTRSNGSGLGLFSARRIAEEHQGSISVTSRTGHGSCFSIRLPAIKPKSEYRIPNS